jgi:hypothetical protein
MRTVLLVVFLVVLHTCLGEAVLAQAPREPKIEILPLRGTLLNDKGVTIMAVDVTYRIEFVPKDAVRAEVQLLRDDEVVRTFPASLKAGINTVTLPAGLQLENAFDIIGAQVEMADGKRSGSTAIVIHDQEDFERRDRLAKARFDRVEPALITKQRSPQFIQVFGSDLAPHATSMTIGGVDADAQLAGNSLKLLVPAAVFDFPGFVTVRSRTGSLETPPNPGQSLQIAVAAPSLPRLGGLTSVNIVGGGTQAVRIDGVEYDANEYNERLRIRGAGFRPQMQIVIGRGQTPIYPLSTEMQSTTSLTAQLPYGVPAGDYFIAILSADKKQLTRAFPIASPDKLRAAAAVPPAREQPSRLDAPGFRVFGDVAWNVAAPQWLYLEGPMARPGLRVWLSREGPPVAVEAIAAEPAAAAGRSHPVVRVPVPPALTHKAVFNISIVIHTK